MKQPTLLFHPLRCFCLLNSISIYSIGSYRYLSTKGILVADLIEKGKVELDHVHIEHAYWESQLLLAHAMNISRKELILCQHPLLSEKTARIFDIFIKKRKNNEPLGYITGMKEFWSLEFKVTKDTLIPRPCTETLIEVALELYQQRQQQLPQKMKILDIGTGCGCILISLLHEWKNASGVGIDVSTKALQVARDNAIQHDVMNRINFIEANYFEGIPSGERYHFIVSNPPYLSKDELTPSKMHPSITHEPFLALNGGNDGLTAYRHIASNCKDYLLPNGHLLLEVGYKQAHHVIDIFKQAGYSQSFHIKKDLNGIDRCIFMNNLSSVY